MKKVETVEEFLARGGKVEKVEKVLVSKGMKTFNTTECHTRGINGNTRMGKNGSGKNRMSERYWNFTDKS
jgi:hypothetical protein|tara:strand:+ start:95 stop:304 length:210 start_codon:yes stop_codon:yes gene_type:complete